MVPDMVEKNGVAPIIPLTRIPPIKNAITVSNGSSFPNGHIPDTRINSSATKNITTARTKISDGEIFSLTPQY